MSLEDLCKTECCLHKEDHFLILRDMGKCNMTDNELSYSRNTAMLGLRRIVMENPYHAMIA
jgi:hypothetical protein